ncbi:hypothetical protein CRE_01950 [Caenorhabditis remanei]|uniref:Uncharacterized protein n=1 Tax=Caenorhabditis remanei TaxID=31234 RepID=E3LGG5_CAERE|nr:hypothetical protein CRE_01950 [Caenorhabditis remanei]
MDIDFGILYFARSQVYMATIDLDTDRKRHVDPEVVLDIGSQLPPVKTVKRNVTQAPDYGDYEDYELTAKPDEVPTTIGPLRRINEKEPALLDSQFKPHIKISMENKKNSAEIRDEVARLMGDLHREELTLRTTVTKEDMTPSTTPVDMMLLGNETMFFSDEEGSGEMVEDELLNVTASTQKTITTTRRPLLFTTLIQEVKAVGVTARPDPFEHLDYDLSDHSNQKKPKTNVKKTVEKQKKFKLHGGFVGATQTANLVRPTRPLQKSINRRPLLVRPNGNNPDRRKNLRKMKKIERMRRVKYLNHRVRAQNRMRLRKVLSKMLFGPRDSDVTSSKQKSTKLKFVGSNGVVTPHPFSRKNNRKPQIEFHKRDKRAVPELQEIDDSGTGAGGAWGKDSSEDTVPIEKSIIESIHFEPHPYYHLRAQPIGTEGRTQVEPSRLINEDPIEEEDDVAPEINLRDALPMKSGLVQVTLKQPRRLKMVTLKSVKKVSKKEKNANGVALVVPSAKKPT